MLILRHKISSYFILAVCCGLTAVSTNAHAQIFKWVDANGRTHYSDERPQDDSIKLQEIRITPAPKRAEQEDSDAQDEQPKQAIEQDNDDSDSDTVEEDNATSDQLLANQGKTKKQKRSLVASSKQAQCTQARKHLAILSRDMPVYRDDQESYRLSWAGDTYDGERNYLSQDERSTALEKAKATIQDSCQNPDNLKAQELARKKWVNDEYCAMNRSILDDLQRADIRATRRQVRKQQELTAKYCEADETLLSSAEYTEPELFPRNKR